MELRPGQIVQSKYRIDGAIGEGGFARVYAATDRETGLHVAIKLLTPDGAPYQPATRARYEREIAILSQLSDPHTVRMHGHGETADGLLYMVFEYLPGRDLGEVIETEGALPAEVVEHVLCQLLASLSEAHRAGLLHRDIKPENVRVFTDGHDTWRVKLLDFGIARAAGREGPSVTKTGELIGTPRYMSPEQLLDKPLTDRSDLYSLGMVAFEALFGRDALQGNRWSDQLDRLQSGHLFSAGGVHESSRLHAVIQRMTARDPERRYPTAAAVLADLRSSAPAREAAVAPSAATSTKTLVAIALGLITAVVALVLLANMLRSTETVEAPQRRIPPDLLKTSRSPAAAARPAPAKVAPTPSAQPTSGCGAAPPFVGRGQLSADIGLQRSEWLTYVPRGHDGSATLPLVVLLHHNWEEPGTLLAATGFERLADEHQFFIVAPYDGASETWRSDDDLPRLRRQFEVTSTELCVDPLRVFVVSQGQGGRAAHKLSCSDWVTGVATNSFQPTSPEFPCERPVPFMMLSALKTEKVPVEGGRNCNDHPRISLAESERIWRARNHCAKEATTTFVDQGSRCMTWKCDTPFESCHVDGGFGWPGTTVRISDTFKGCDGEPPNFPTGEQIWRFFSQL